jgi:inhibitor of KinA
MSCEARYLLAGDKALVVEFGNEISEEVNKNVRNLYVALINYKIDGIEEITPTYRSILIQYNPLIIGLDSLKGRLKELLGKLSEVAIPKPRIIEIPTLYGGESGPDLQFVAEHNEIPPDEVIQIHSSADYLIYMLGFTPGFPYLGGMSEKIAAPRLAVPRTKIPAGSVGIAGKQTGIYPIESPGGWQLIGRTPLKLYEPKRQPPIILQAGDYIRFVPVNIDKYNEISELIQQDKYSINILEK